MITQKNKELAKWALDFALRNGCSDARISVYAGTNNSFEYRDTQLDKLEQSSENGMSLQLYVDGRFASYSTNRLDKAELEKFILKGIEAARYLAIDEFRQLPDPARYYRGTGDLGLSDKEIDSVSVDDKLALLRENVDEVRGTDNRIISISAGYDDGTSGSYAITSNGFEGESKTTYYSLSTSVSMKGAGDARPESGWYDSAIFWNKLQKSGIGKTAYERTLRKLGQEKIETGVYDMLLDNLSSSRLLSPIISAISGSSIQQKSSFLIDKVGQKIFSDKVNLIDDPHIPNARGARWFDGEGVATQRFDVIKDGVLKMYYIDTYNGLKLGMEPTIQSPSLLRMELGKNDFDGIMATMKRGIWVTGFNGGNSNPTTGDFSFGIEGFLIEDGKAVKPLNEMNITGNLLELWQQVEQVGNDPRLTSSWRIPSLLFKGVNFSGK
ncbi:TldD/PmbA family protein [Bacteroidales bacterium OttesenSCG-928-L03]|nr:TldD/PmbA family protein [Bacteroidales bacterium OttesenSCG-928-L03]MDL2241470.1 TldD/PmbA family protein [Bacteroidales bacterium OttesenSCG-928-L03]